MTVDVVSALRPDSLVAEAVGLGVFSSSAVVLGGPGDNVTLFPPSETDAWVVLIICFVVLLSIDLLCFGIQARTMTFKTAALSTCCLVACAMGFNGYVFWRFGTDAAWQWASAYSLEWLLSFDNLFVFHTIFATYKTPLEQRHRPLFMGILGAVALRLLFFWSAEMLLHTVWFAHYFFGALLVVVGVRSVMGDDADDDKPHWFARKAVEYFPFVDYYSDDGAFFVKVKVNSSGQPIVTGSSTYGAVDVGNGADASGGIQEKWKGTMLLLVLLCLESADILFAVDSVSAVVAQVNHLFLAYSAVIFAMLGLRSGYHLVDSLTQTFDLVQYGIAAVLIFIGVKLMCASYFTVTPMVTCLVLVGTLSISVLLSWMSNSPTSDSNVKPTAETA